MDGEDGQSQISGVTVVENLFKSVHEMSLKQTASGMMLHMQC